MTTWTPLAGFPHLEVSDTGRTRSINRQLPVPFRKARVLGDSAPDQVITHPHTEQRDPMGTVIPPTRPRGDTQVNVMDFGAAGNGTTDDTDAFAAAIAALPSTGGTVYVPNNDYLIDAERSIKLRSKMRLQMDLNARLLAKPTSSPSYSVVLGQDVQDIEVDGGQVIGERDAHTGTGGEGGMGIRIIGCTRVTLKNTFASKCWGDGFYVGGSNRNRNQSSDVVISNVVSTGNRRQGLSITNAHTVKVYDSEFSDTHGTAPQCGLDIEPNAEDATGGFARDIYIENVVFKNNASSGVHIQRRTERVTFKRCTMEGNAKKGIEALAANILTIDECVVRRNTGAGITTSKESSYVTVKDTTFRENQGKAPRAAPIVKAGVVRGTKNDLSVGASAPSILTNRYE